MSEILNFWLSISISQMPPYLMFIVVSKSTYPLSLLPSSQNAQCFYLRIRSNKASPKLERNLILERKRLVFIPIFIFYSVN